MEKSKNFPLLTRIDVKLTTDFRTGFLRLRAGTECRNESAHFLGDPQNDQLGEVMFNLGEGIWPEVK